MIDDETPEFWRRNAKEDLAIRVAALHQQRRELLTSLDAREILGARRAIAHSFLRGSGVEVGAGDRPFPLPDTVQCHYGDVRDHSELVKYFGNDRVTLAGRIDAQTFSGVPAASLDFVISAHVIEHLYDPIGSIRSTIRSLKPGGVFVCVVPEMTKTWDHARPPTTLAHVEADSLDGGEASRLQAYIEHVTYVHPTLTGEHIASDQIEAHARATMAAGMDLHVHAWRACDFVAMLRAIAAASGFTIEAQVPVINENIFVLRREVGPVAT